MIALVFAVAALLLIIAIVLLVLDSRRKHVSDESTAPTPDESTPLAHNQGEATSSSLGNSATEESSSVEASSVAATADDAASDTAVDAENSDEVDSALLVNEPEGPGAAEESAITEQEATAPTPEPEPESAREPEPFIESIGDAVTQPVAEAKESLAPEPSSEESPEDNQAEGNQTADNPSVGNQAEGKQPERKEPLTKPFTQPKRARTGIIPVEMPDGSKSHRRQRKAWAKERNADYLRIDRNLQSNWCFTPDGDAKAVVGGFSHGRQSYVFDAGDYTVVALRRSVASAERFELARNTSSELPKVAVEAGLLVSATTPALIHRIFDDRASAMLASIPRFVERIWSESNWALAQLPRTAGAEHWEQTLDVLNDFSNIARRLPPAEGEVATLDESSWDPTRAQLAAHAGATDESASRRHGHLQAVSERESSSNCGGADAASRAEHAPLDVDVVDAESNEDYASSKISITGISAKRGDSADAENWRPKRDSTLESMNLPSRSVPRKMGEGDVQSQLQSQLQSQEVPGSSSAIPALGEDPEHSRMRVTGGGIIRHNEKPASIFADAADAADEQDTAASDTTETTDTDATHTDATNTETEQD